MNKIVHKLKCYDRQFKLSTSKLVVYKSMSVRDISEALSIKDTTGTLSIKSTI